MRFVSFFSPLVRPYPNVLTGLYSVSVGSNLTAWLVRVKEKAQFLTVAGSSTSEDVLEGELHDSGVFCGRNLTEIGGIEIGHRVLHVKRVCKVEGLRSKFQLLRFTNLERSCQRRVELPGARPGDAAHAYISQRAQGRQNKCGRIEVVRDRFIAIGTAHDLI